MNENLNPTDGNAANRSAFLKIVATLGINRFKTESKIVIDDALVQAEIFAFDSGQALTQLPTHGNVLIQVIDGEFEVSAAQETVRLSAGGLLQTMSILRQSLFCTKAGHLILFRFRAESTIFRASMGFA